ncbi:helix-turn-helix DNA binding protein [Gordonia phage Ribeye]|uniref:Helix-turn-helix DNA binding protein n=1 Tax=Gordonia phage Ribeye TaxID=2250417 RepID=A0A345KPB2_9CAUD|nr:Rnase E [Gordonia phage Ribeye]AXH44864.1 helix-turn-helix DNA binding protein [Gordonia phage Ribeye]
MPRGTSKRVDAANDLRRGRMVDMWLRGHTYQEIAKELGVRSHAGIYRQIQKELRLRAQERADLADEALELQLQRIEAILRTHMMIATNPADPLAAARSARVALEAIDRLNRLLGVDQPQRHEVTVTTVDAVDREIARLTALLTGHAEEKGVDVSDLTTLQQLAAQAEA